MSAQSRRTFLRLAVLTPVSSPFHAAAGMFAQQPAPLIPRPDVEFRLDVDLVRLSVTARDARGGIVHDLTRDEFRIREDGIDQEVEHFGHHDAPISAVVLVDKSRSMAFEKLMHAKDGVVAFVRALRRQDEALIVAFSDSIDALGDFGLDARRIERAVEDIDWEAGTRLYDAVVEAARVIMTPGRKEKRAMLILSDGEDTASYAKLRDAVEAVRRAEVSAYAIGIELEEDADSLWRRDPLWRRLGGGEPSALDALRRITDGTGGWTYSVGAAKRCKDVCQRVADEVRNQYVLGYYPTNRRRDGTWRAIAVEVTRPGVTLATREGYYAPRES